MDTLIIIVTIIDVMVAVLLIGVILVQQSKDGGMAGSAFGGAGDAVFGGQAADQLTKITRVLVTLFFILTLSLAVIIGRRTDKNVSVVDKEISIDTSSTTNDKPKVTTDSAKDSVKKATDSVKKVTSDVKKTTDETKKSDKVVAPVTKKAKKTTIKLDAKKVETEKK